MRADQHAHDEPHDTPDRLDYDDYRCGLLDKVPHPAPQALGLKLEQEWRATFVQVDMVRYITSPFGVPESHNNSVFEMI